MLEWAGVGFGQAEPGGDGLGEGGTPRSPPQQWNLHIQRHDTWPTVEKEEEEED